jgi:hypothetical protein
VSLLHWYAVAAHGARLMGDAQRAKDFFTKCRYYAQELFDVTDPIVAGLPTPSVHFSVI